jgi:hypothetical protein
LQGQLNTRDLRVIAVVKIIDGIVACPLASQEPLQLSETHGIHGRAKAFHELDRRSFDIVRVVKRVDLLGSRAKAPGSRLQGADL